MNKHKKTFRMEELSPGMVLAENVYDNDGNILLSEGLALRDVYISKIKELDINSVKILSTVSESPIIDNNFKNILKRDLEIKEAKYEARKIVQDTFNKVYTGKGVQSERIFLVVNKIIDEILMNEDIVLNLSHMKSIDDYVFEHSVNVTIISILLGIHLGFNKIQLIELGVGAILHDIGKMLVPQEILNKPSQLNNEEFDVIKQHTVLGYELVRKIKNISLKSCRVVLQHHEKVGGSGYPEGKTIDDIHIYSRIVAIADVFDALTSDRVYSEKIDPHRATAIIIEGIENHFEHNLVKLFINIFKYYPKGLRVTINSNEVGYVIKEREARPKVKILVDEYGNKLANHFEVDLFTNPKNQIIDFNLEGMIKI
ncbi:MAG: HD-GYP domain-containing protein [Firmicutes bacterium]|jgi:putative nucleotidyltransferase with HDIG domain|nr:HD-GYP domain-containing protein [Bacillota bacterium]